MENTDKKDIYFSEYEWEEISYYKYLSEEFIREFKDKVNWYYVSKYQKLSEEFIQAFKSKIYNIIKSNNAKDKKIKR